MAKLFKVLVCFIAGLAGVFAFLAISAYFFVFTHTMSKDEAAIYERIRARLVRAGDKVALTEIHDAKWLSACINPTDTFSGMEPDIVKVKNVTTLNSAEPVSGEVTWGLYFVYPNDQIEYYSFPNDKILADSSRGYSAEGKNCEQRENAVIEVKEVYDDKLIIRLIGK